MNQKIVVVGSSNTDMIVGTTRLPLPGETVLGNEFVMAAGGKGANQAVAAARLGGEVAFVARLGQDHFGDQALANLQKEGIDTCCVRLDPQAPSGVALIMVGEDGQNIIAVAPGANGRLTPEDIEEARALLMDAKVVLLQLEIPMTAIVEAVRISHLAKSIVMLNPAPGRELPAALLQQVDILTPNESEAMLMTGRSTPEAAAQAILGQGVKTVIVTMGAAGVLLGQAGAKIKSIPAYRVNVLDTTAAGDAFNGGMAVALACGESIETAIRFAQAAAALSATRRGAQPSLPGREEVDIFLQQHGTYNRSGNELP